MVNMGEGVVDGAETCLCSDVTDMRRMMMQRVVDVRLLWRERVVVE